MPGGDHDTTEFRYSGVSPRVAGEGVRGRVTLKDLRAWAERGEAFACLACYDATTARLLARSGVPVLLVGDSAAETVLGFDRTHFMPLEVLLALTAGVRRGAPGVLVMGDMPFLSYHGDAGEALRTAGRFMIEGGADVVKVEADASFSGLVERMTRAGIAVCAHVGSRPQLAALRGGYGSAGRTGDEARRIVEDAVALEAAGAVLLLIEAVPEEVTAAVLEATRVPVIGIGAGPACHGQVLVVNDLLGMTDAPPRFADPVAGVGKTIEEAGRAWVERVRQRSIGGRGYRMAAGESEKIADPSAWDPRGCDGGNGHNPPR